MDYVLAQRKYLLNIVKNHNLQNNLFHKLCSNATKIVA